MAVASAGPYAKNLHHTNTSSLSLYRLDALPDAQPTVSEHWRHWSTPEMLVKWSADYFGVAGRENWWFFIVTFEWEPCVWHIPCLFYLLDDRPPCVCVCVCVCAGWLNPVIVLVVSCASGRTDHAVEHCIRLRGDTHAGRGRVMMRTLAKSRWTFAAYILCDRCRRHEGGIVSSAGWQVTPCDHPMACEFT